MIPSRSFSEDKGREELKLNAAVYSRELSVAEDA